MAEKKVRRFLGLLTAALVAVLFSAAMFTIVSKWAGLPLRLRDSQNLPYLILALAFPAAVVVTARRGPYQSRFKKPALVMFLLACMVFLPFVFIYDALGTYRLSTIIYSFQESTLSQLTVVGFGEFRSSIMDFLLVMTVLVIGGVALHRWLPHFDKLLLAISAIFFLESPILAYAYQTVIPNPHHARINVETDFSAPTILARPDTKPNVLMIYMESMERSFRDLKETKEAFRHLARLEDSGLSFRNLDQIHGTEFSAGGLVATQCGIPLLPRGAMTVHAGDSNRQLNKIFETEGFLPHITCLGDILTEDGYTGSYMNGSELSMFSIGPFVETHGYERLTGIETLGPEFGELYENTWGLNDESLFRLAKAEIAELVAAGDPFFMTVLTVATHAGDGVLDPNCTFPPVAGSRIPAAIFCTGEHVMGLLDELDRLGIAENTIVVLLNDHFIMRNTLSGPLASASDARRNFFVALGTDMTGENTSYGSMLDVYPTLLEILGYRVEDRRANLGISLLSDQPTLAERLGPTDLTRALDGNTRLSSFLWFADGQTSPD